VQYSPIEMAKVGDNQLSQHEREGRGRSRGKSSVGEKIIPGDWSSASSVGLATDGGEEGDGFMSKKREEGGGKGGRGRKKVS